MTDMNDAKKKYIGTLVRRSETLSGSRSGLILVVSSLESKLSPEQMIRLSNISRMG